MSEKNQPGNGVLFKNDRKESDNHPDYKGRIVETDGTERWLSAWINESKAGTKYMKVSVGKPCAETSHEGANQAREATQGGGPTDDFDDDLAF